MNDTYARYYLHRKVTNRVVTLLKNRQATCPYDLQFRQNRDSIHGQRQTLDTIDMIYSRPSKRSSSSREVHTPDSPSVVIFCCKEISFDVQITGSKIIILELCNRVQMIREAIAVSGKNGRFLFPSVRLLSEDGRTRKSEILIEISPSKSFRNSYQQIFDHKVGIAIEKFIYPDGLIFDEEMISQISVLANERIFILSQFARRFRGLVVNRLLRAGKQTDNWYFIAKSQGGLEFDSRKFFEDDLNRADPFVHQLNHDSVVILFEEWNTGDQGSISAVQFRENSWHKIGTVVKEDYHLSYPSILKFNNLLIMFPQAGIRKRQLIYTSVDGAVSWELFKSIELQESLVDVNVFEWEGLWWLLGAAKDPYTGSRSNRLMAYYAENPLSEVWIPHERNPLVWSDRFSRGGGSVMVSKDFSGLTRAVQAHGADEYGVGVYFSRILKISPTEFEFIPVNNPSVFWGKNLSGHHFSVDQHQDWSARDFKVPRHIFRRKKSR